MISGNTVSCAARDASGKSVACASSNASLIETARALQSDSFLLFTVNKSGECTSLQVRTGSRYEPKAP